MRTTRPGPPRAMRVWSSLMSAASTTSSSSPTSNTRLPVLTSNTTTLPALAPTPPPANSSEPLRLNLSTWAMPSGNGNTPSSLAVSVL